MTRVLGYCTGRAHTPQTLQALKRRLNLPLSKRSKMPKWWQKAIDKVGDAFEDVADAVEDAADTVLDAGKDLVKSGDCYQTIKMLKDNGSECFQLAKETTELCENTQSRGDEMIQFGSEITETLHGFSTKMDVETLETIKDLMDGDRLKESMALCQEMDEIAISCVDKSHRMIEIMEETMDTVPGPVQKIMSKAAGKDDDETLAEKERSLVVLSTLDQDVEDVKACIDSLQHLDIASALQIGTKAFENLSAKAVQSRDMFNIMRGFSEEVSGYTEAISEGDIEDVFKLATKVKDMWHCMKLTSFMRQLAAGAGKLIQVIIDLFKAMSDRLSTLWAALAYAKDCMVDCIEHVVQARDLVLNAREQSKLLIERSLAVADQLQDLGKFNKKSIEAARKLNEGDDVEEAISIATNMDDLVLECTGKVVSMVERVTEGFQNLPDIVTSDVDVEEEGKNDDDPEPDDVEENIQNLEKSREIIENEDIITSAKESVKSFRGVLDIEDECENMLSLIQGFSTDCNATIDSFLGAWDLESAMVKISEMCRVVKLGEMIKEFAANIKRLLKAIIALMKSMIEKLTLENLTKIDLGDAVDEAVDAMKDKLGDVADKLKFWD